MSDELKYSDAMKRIEEILNEIEGEKVDIDDLSVCVKEAVGLIKSCKKKIEETSMEVKNVVEELEKSESESEQKP